MHSSSSSKLGSYIKLQSSIKATFAQATGHSKGIHVCIRAKLAQVIPQKPNSAESQFADNTVAII
ncbi:hypothetical protein HOF65_06960 [bacterium]|nr:hypothetical protein [bacterium]MBT3853658.1 hypothetical protein [bacterium]